MDIIKLVPEWALSGLPVQHCAYPALVLKRAGSEVLFQVIGRHGEVAVQTAHASLADGLRQLAQSVEIYGNHRIRYISENEN